MRRRTGVGVRRQLGRLACGCPGTVLPLPWLAKFAQLARSCMHLLRNPRICHRQGTIDASDDPTLIFWLAAFSGPLACREKASRNMESLQPFSHFAGLYLLLCSPLHLRSPFGRGDGRMAANNLSVARSTWQPPNLSGTASGQLPEDRSAAPGIQGYALSNSGEADSVLKFALESIPHRTSIDEALAHGDR